MSHVTVTIDGTEVSVPAGSTLLTAVREAGMDMPTLCFGPTLTPANVCRVCMVEVEGSRTLVPSCSRVAEEGMVVSTGSNRARHSRRLVMELLGSASELDRADEALDRWMTAHPGSLNHATSRSLRGCRRLPR